MKRSKHRLSHTRLASLDMGQLVPVGCVEVLPGDTFRHSASCLLRVGTLVTPLMHSVSARIHHWFVPSRVAMEAYWQSDSSGAHNTWENFMNNDPDDYGLSTKDLPITTEQVTAGSLLNHLGIPVGVEDMNINALPLVAYQMIYHQFYADQELQEPAEDQYNNPAKLIQIRRCCWSKDYFTSARTYPQYGDTAVSIPFDVGLTAPVGVDSTGFKQLETGGLVSGTSADGRGVRRVDTNDAPASDLALIANVSDTSGGIDVNDFRRSIALQRFLEARSRFGSRYRDYLRYLGVRPRDGRLEQPEYLGGGKQTVAFSEVLATAEGTTVEVGDMAGHGIAALRTRPYTRFFEEHGFVLSLLSVRPKSVYMNSINRHWMRATRDDYWQKEYEAFGPQAVPVKEVYAPHPNETDIFGYQDRFREYREHPSYVSGLFNTTDDDWHLAREFSSAPSLNASFVECTPTDRVYADANAPELRCMVNHNLVARRLVSQRAR